MTKQTSIQVNDALARQIEALRAQGFGPHFTDIVRTAVDRMYQQEAAMNARNTPAQDHIIDHLGCDNWAQVKALFERMTFEQVLERLDATFTADDNTDLAQRIVDALR